MEAFFNLTLPKSWTDLSDHQLLYYFRQLATDFQGVPFSTFITTDNYYQGFLHTHDPNLLRDAATELYQKVKRKHLTTAHSLSIFYWLASLKQYLARNSDKQKFFRTW